MHKLSYGAAVLALTFGMSGAAVAQTAVTPGPGPATDYPTGTTNLPVPASCTPTDVASVRSDLGSVQDQAMRNQIEVQLLQQAEIDLRDGQLARCAQILANARAAIVQHGGEVSDTTALGVGGGTGVPATPSEGMETPGTAGPAMTDDTAGGAMGGAAAGGAATGVGDAEMATGPYTAQECQPVNWAPLVDQLGQLEGTQRAQADQLLNEAQREYQAGNFARCANALNQAHAMIETASR